MSAGILKTRSARTIAIDRPESAATQTRVFRKTSDAKSVITGSAETAVESGQACSGS
jgi:hypothetical protein